jgi:hypothetical protein
MEPEDSLHFHKSSPLVLVLSYVNPAITLWCIGLRYTLIRQNWVVTLYTRRSDIKTFYFLPLESM